MLDYPIGALTLAILAVSGHVHVVHTQSILTYTLQATHALKHYTSGKWDPPKGRAGYFSEDNYGDTTVFKNGAYMQDACLGRILRVVQDLSDVEWTEIYTAAYDVVKRRQVAKGCQGKKRASESATGGALERAGSGAANAADDDDLMLVADA